MAFDRAMAGIYQGDYEMLTSATKMDGFDVNAGEHWGLIHFAAKRGDTKALKILLECHEVDVNKTSSDGSTALHFAYNYSKPEAVIMLESDPRVDRTIKDSDGKEAHQVQPEPDWDKETREAGPSSVRFYFLGSNQKNDK